MIATADLGKTIRLLRGDKTSQRKLAVLLQITPVHLCNVERGKNRPSWDLLYDIGCIYGVDVYLLTCCLYGDRSELPNPQAKAFNRFSRSLFHSLRKKWKTP